MSEQKKNYYLIIGLISGRKIRTIPENKSTLEEAEKSKQKFGDMIIKGNGWYDLETTEGKILVLYNNIESLEIGVPDYDE